MLLRIGAPRLAAKKKRDAFVINILLTDEWMLDHIMVLDTEGNENQKDARSLF